MSADDAFAKPEDLEARWHPLTGEERTRAAVLLADAADIIRSECPGWELAPASTLTRISCQMVRTAMGNDDTAGVTQANQTVGPFSQGYTYANPTGDLYLTRAQRRQLGAIGQRTQVWEVGDDPGN